MTDEEIYKLWDSNYRSWIGAEQFESIFKHAASIERDVCAKVCREIMDDFFIGDVQWEVARHCKERIEERSNA